MKNEQVGIFLAVITWSSSLAVSACYYAANNGDCILCLSCQLNNAQGGTFTSESACTSYIESDLDNLSTAASTLLSSSTYYYESGNCYVEVRLRHAGFALRCLDVELNHPVSLDLQTASCSCRQLVTVLPPRSSILRFSAQQVRWPPQILSSFQTLPHRRLPHPSHRRHRKLFQLHHRQPTVFQATRCCRPRSGILFNRSWWQLKCLCCLQPNHRQAR